MPRTLLITVSALVAGLMFASTAAAEKLVVPVSLEGIEYDSHRGRPTEPRSAKTAEELEKLVGEEGAAKLKERFDISSHDFVLFQWAGSGQDSISAVVEEGAVVFQYKRGLTRDLRQHRNAFAVKKGVAWKVETLPFR